MNNLINEVSAIYNDKNLNKLDISYKDFSVWEHEQLLNEGAQAVIVSLGGEGAIYVDQQTRLKAIVPSGQVVNTVGSGDSTVAGMVAGLEADKDIESAFKLAVSCGTATAFNADLANIEDIEKIISKVIIKHV